MPRKKRFSKKATPRQVAVSKLRTRRDIGVLEGTSHVAVLHNAIRLLEDARLLRKARRYPSSVALAILSLEEVAKFIAFNEDFADWISTKHRLGGRHRYDHRQKQKLAAQAIIWALGFDEVRDLMEVQGYRQILVPMGTKLSDEPSVVDVIAAISDRTFQEKVANKIKRSGHHRIVIDLAAGRFDKIKQESFYVDENDDGTLRVPRLQIDRATADRIIRLASGAIYSTKMTLRYAKRLREHATAP
jgi:AbiV family abortive infection protein